ncbi:cytoplasmic tRNA 2-thiolation protein 2 [Toxorhynchites rutilus septentrionalis]|uniref:cytoplasmic tRNA 2-thiolation protein 2 n=1 Tax=Toxorhynchites rutilus septentrionalis TaxID=329112 RepID=UPI00247852DA|nr:cytoplasmic tRNA 2-thiolation protein 2 [Toxorhynchites rutilus septentrionalis]
MCSIVEDDFGDEGGAHVMKEESPESGPVADELCRKCNENQAVLKLNLKEPQCRSCFLHFVRHKFRASLGSTKIVRRGSRVLVIFNGTRENVVMLDMIRHGLQQESFKKLRIIPVVLFVDEDFIRPNREKYLQLMEEKLAVLKQFDFAAHFTVLGGQNSCLITESDLVDRFREGQCRFKTILDGCKSVTSKQDFINQVRRRTYINIAQELDCSYIFLSDIGLDLAKTLLSNVALGRGRGLSLDIAFCDDRDGRSKIIRPIRDLNPDEIENYIIFADNQLSFVAWEDPFEGKSSLQNLTSKFVDGLQQTFPSTVSTVFRTGDKLDAQKLSETVTDSCPDQDMLTLFDKSLKISISDTQEMRCKFCHSVLDYQNSTTLFAIEFSRIVSSRINIEQSHEENAESAHKMKQDARSAVNAESGEDDMDQLKRNLCHSCRNIFTDFE